MKKVMLILALLILPTVAFAGLMGGSQPVLSGSGSASIAVVSDQSIYTTSFPLYSADVFGVWAKATSVTGTATVKLELEQSYALPTTEGAADTKFVEPDGFADVMSLTDELAHVDTLAPVPMPYGRYKITGNAGNPADTVVTIYNFLQGNN